MPAFPNLQGGVVFVGVDGRNRYQYNWDTNNIAPRLGASYQLNDKTVVRAGYSHIFGPSNQGAQGTVGPFGFRTENLWVTSIDGITPFNLLRNPYPNGFTPSPGSSQGLLTQAGANLQAPLQDTPSPWTIQYNVNVQRELPWGLFVEAAYVGTRGYDLSIAGEGGLSLNQLDPQYMALGSQLNQQVANPFYGIVNNGVLTSPTVSRGQLLRPYPQFTDIIPLYAAGAKSRYNALQLTGRKRLSHGLMFEGSYTFAKAEEIGMNHQNSYDIEASWALASYDINHRFVLSYLYEIPVGRNRRFFANAPAVVERADRRLAVQRHHDAPGGHAALDHREQHRRDSSARGRSRTAPARIRVWTGRSRIASAATSTPASTASRRRSSSATSRSSRRCCARTASATSTCRSSRASRSRRGVTAQFRIEALNAFNRVQFSAPNTSVTSTSFGVITGQANAPRQLQFGVKLLW